jgi:predicted GTPase
MAYERNMQQIFEKEIANALKEKNIHISEPDLDAVAHEALLTSKAFIRTRPPVIAVTGVTSTGKSTLINALFGEKKVKEGLTADTTDKIVIIRFRSGLVIYDTPGAGGEERLENVTRAYLGLQQLDKDIYGNDLPAIDMIPVINADNYNEATGEPKFFKKHEEFEKPDLFIFVVNVRAGAVKREDIAFFQQVVKLGRPVIVAINQIDGEEKERIDAGIDLIKRKLDRQAIPISAKERQNIQEIAVTIANILPPECGEALRDTINENYKKLIRYQQVLLYSTATAIKVARQVGIQEIVTDSFQLVSHIIALYAWIVDGYNLKDQTLKSAGISFSASLTSLEEKLVEASEDNGGIRLLAAVGTIAGVTAGAIATILTGGVALPGTLLIGGAAIGGTSIGTLIGIFNELFRRKRILNASDESQTLKPYISTANKYETAVTVLAFGRALHKCCDMLETRSGSDLTAIHFKDIFAQEYPLADEGLKPFIDRINAIHSGNDDRLIKDIYISMR